LALAPLFGERKLEAKPTHFAALQGRSLDQLVEDTYTLLRRRSPLHRGREAWWKTWGAFANA
jgi:hypothetical protein